MYGNVLAGGTDRESQSKTGMYDQAAGAVSRLQIQNNRLSDLLARFRGSHPSQVPGIEKNQSAPCLMEVGRNLHNEIDMLDKQISEFAEIIG